jgi:hypothetical protein
VRNSGSVPQQKYPGPQLPQLMVLWILHTGSVTVALPHSIPIVAQASAADGSVQHAPVTPLQTSLARGQHTPLQVFWLTQTHWLFWHSYPFVQSGQVYVPPHWLSNVPHFPEQSDAGVQHALL